MTWNLEAILRHAREHSASDVHMVRGVAPAVRIVRIVGTQFYVSSL